MEEKLLNTIEESIKTLETTKNESIERLKKEQKLDLAYESLQKRKAEAEEEIRNHGEGSREASIDLEKINKELGEIKNKEDEIVKKVENKIRTTKRELTEAKKTVNEKETAQKAIEGIEKEIKNLEKHKEEALTEIRSHGEGSKEASSDLEIIEEQLKKLKDAKEKNEDIIKKADIKINKYAEKYEIKENTKDDSEKIKNEYQSILQEKENLQELMEKTEGYTAPELYEARTQQLKKLDEKLNQLENSRPDLFPKDKIEEQELDKNKLIEEWEKAKNDRELEMWDEAIKENEEYDKKKFLQDWEDAIEENKEFDEIHRVESELNPKTGTEPNPKPGTQLNPKQGTQLNPKTGTEPNPKQGTEPNPKQGTEPNPKPEKDAKITRIKIFDARNSIELVKENSDGQEITDEKNDYIKDALKNRKDIFRDGMLKEIIKVSADSKTKLGSLIKQARIKRKLNPVVLKALIDNGQYETVMGYVESVCNKKECEMLKVEHYLMNSQLGFFQKRMMNRIGKFENQIEGNVIQGLPEKQSKVAGLLGKGKRKIKNTPTTIKSGIKLAGKVISKPLKTIKKPFEAAIKVSKSVKDNLAKVSQAYYDYDLENVKDDEPEITNEDDLEKE